MDSIDRRRFLVGMTAALAACDRVVVDLKGDDGLAVDENGRSFIPSITSNEDFYVYQVFQKPEVNPDTWQLQFFDNNTPIGSIDRAFLDSLVPREIELTLQCIGATVVSRRLDNAMWTGLPLAEVLAAAGISGPTANTVEVVLRGADDYDASVPVSDYEGAPIWLIWGMNGEVLPYDHGAPARLLVPGRYGIKNLKWITEIRWWNSVYSAFWDESGWSHLAAYRVNGFIHLPGWNDEVKGPVQVIGSAFAGEDPIKKVELTDDGGKSWKTCRIDYENGPGVWTLWSVTWRPRETGEYDIQVRVTSQSGKRSSMNPSGTSPKNGYDGGQLLTLVVV